jgi:hypothetical protein
MDLIALKVAGSSLVAILVTLQALIMLQLSGRGRVFPLPEAALMRWHRRQGYVLLALIGVIAYACVAHASSGTLLLTGRVGKVLSVRAVPRLRRFAPALGLLLVLAAVVTVGSTVPWYFFRWLVRGIRPIY